MYNKYPYFRNVQGDDMQSKNLCIGAMGGGRVLPMVLTIHVYQCRAVRARKTCPAADQTLSSKLQNFKVTMSVLFIFSFFLAASFLPELVYVDIFTKLRFSHRMQSGWETLPERQHDWR